MPDPIRSRAWLLPAAVLSLVGNLCAQDQALIAKGQKLFLQKICATCHQVPDGPPALAGIAMQAPKFEGDFWGKDREVTLGFGGKDATVRFDEAYFIESIRKPMAKVVKASAAPMPPPPGVSDEEMKALIAYVRSLSVAEGTAAAGVLTGMGSIPDLRYRVYHGTWDKLPDFGALEPVHEGAVEDGIADTRISKKRDDFGLVLEGHLEVTRAGKYSFDLGSDDGSRLIVNGKRIIDNDGLHGFKNVTGSVELPVGPAAIRIEYFEKNGGEHLSMYMSGPGVQALQLARDAAPKNKPKPELLTGNPILPTDGEATIYRNFIKGASPRGIGVGYPEGVNICFDANAMNIVLAWHGAFMDGARHWNGRGQGFQPPSGHYLLTLPRVQAIASLQDARAPWPTLSTSNNDDARASGLRFLGYRLAAGRRPVFRYTAGKTFIEDEVIPKAGALPSFTRRLTLTGDGTLYHLAATDPVIEKQGDSWKIGETLKLTLDPPTPPILRDGPAGKELLVPLTVKRQLRILVRYEWDLD